MFVRAATVAAPRIILHHKKAMNSRRFGVVRSVNMVDSAGTRCFLPPARESRIEPVSFL
jgi:hypothetical protein